MPVFNHTQSIGIRRLKLWSPALLLAFYFIPAILHAADAPSGSQIESHSFGGLNWLVLFTYLAILVFIGFRCSKRNVDTSNFFLAGRAIPWWAAGLSLFSTLLSAITYLAIPARAYATDWTLLPINLCVLIAAPLIVWKYLPLFRSEPITTIYEFLAKRFDTSVQKFGSASFIFFQLGRMGIVLLLPALALSAVTGINLHLCIVLMGLLATLYTVLGGIEAVIWTDVLQTVVLLGGAIVALFIISGSLEGGFAGMVRNAGEAGKFHWLNPGANLFEESILVVILGGLFSNALVPYSSDQAVVQRYLTTRDASAAKRSLWLGAIMVLPATLLFLSLGTALFVFFDEHPEALMPLESNEQILPWFIATQMPAGLAGLVIAGVFAAAMSSLDSSMHSISTSIVTDWLKPLGWQRTDKDWLGIARRITLAAGLFGTLTALLLGAAEIQFLWDFFLALMGLLGGTLAGVVAAAVFLPNVSSRHLCPAILVSVGLLIGVNFFTDLHKLLFGFLGIVSVVSASWALTVLRRS